MGYGHESKRYYCFGAMGVIEEGFKKHMPLKMVAFDAHGSDYVTHEIIKDWNETKNKSCAYNFMKKGRGGCGNKDGYSIRIATKELMHRPERKKILFILSDGMPSCYELNNEGVVDVKNAVEQARKMGIEVVGIYFSEGAQNDSNAKTFERMYQKNYIITTPEQIDDELIRLMKKFVF